MLCLGRDETTQQATTFFQYLIGKAIVCCISANEKEGKQPRILTAVM